MDKLRRFKGTEEAREAERRVLQWLQHASKLGDFIVNRICLTEILKAAHGFMPSEVPDDDYCLPASLKAPHLW